MRISLQIWGISLFSILFILPAGLSACTQPPVPSISSSGQLTFCNGQSVTLTASSGTGYSYQWKKDGSTISGATNQTYVASVTGSYTVVVTVDTCNNTSLSSNITVNPTPNGTLTADHSICQGASTTLVAGGGVSYNWNAPGAVGNAITVSPNSTTNYSVTVSNSFGCNDIKTVQVTVKPLPQANVSVAGSSALCQGQSVNLNASAGAGYGYQWYKNNVLLNGATNQQLTVNSAGDYHVAVTLNSCTKESAPRAITVNPLPVPGTSGDATICSGDTIVMQASGGVSYQWSSGGPATANYAVAPTSTRTYTVTVTNSFGCTASANVIITVKPLPNANISLSGSAAICSGQSVTLNASNGTGYSHQWYKNNILLNGEPNPSLVVSAGGDYHVVVTYDGCSKTSTPKTITVNPVPVPVVSPDATTCAGDAIVLHASGGVSYQWSSGGPATADYAVAPTSSKIYTVTVTNSFNCTASANVTITVKPLPNAIISLSGSATICAGQNVTLNASNGTGYSHQWYKNNILLNGETNPSLVVSTAGDYHVVVTSDGCSKTSTPKTITVNPVPVPVVSPDASTCAGDAIVLHASGGVSYQWSSGGPATADYAVAPTSSKIYSVTVTNSFNCTASANVTITVKTLPNANLSFSGGTALCSGQSVNLNVSNGTDYSHQWYKNNVLLAGETNPTLVVSSAGSYHAVVTFDGCSRTSSQQAFTVNPAPAIIISDDTTVCAEDTFTISASGGVAYQWNSGGPATAAFTLALSSTKTYTVTVTNSFGCTASASVTITVLPLPQAWLSASGSTTICDGKTVNLNTAGATGYSHKWYKNGNIIAGANASSYMASVAGGYFVINTENGCSAASSVVQISVNALPVTDISPNVAICSGDSTQLTATGGTLYNWNIGPATSSIVVAPTSSRTYNVTITDANGCSVQESTTVTVTGLPNAFLSLSGPATFCADKSLTITTSSGTGYSFQWYKNNFVIPGATSQQLTVTATGNYLVKVSANGCSRNSNMTNVIVNPLPVASYSNDTTICSADTIQLHASGGTAYQWSNSGSNSFIQIAPNNNTNYSVTVSNSFGCSVSNTISVTTIARPPATASPMGTVSICQGQTATLTANSGTGYTYQWMQGISTLNGQTNPTFTTSLAGNYHVVVKANGCPKKSNAVQVNVNPLPFAVVSNDTTICSGNSVVLTVAGGSTYKWSTGSINSAITVTPASSIAYYVTVTSSFGCASTGDVFISVIPSPSASITTSGSLAICSGSTVTISASTGVGYTYQWIKNGFNIPGAAGSSYVASQTGIYIVAVSANGCTKTSSVQNVTVNPLPMAVVSNDETICQGESASLSASGGVTYRWSNGRGTDVITVTPNLTTVFKVTVTDANGCTDSDSVTVNVKPLPNAFISSSSSTNLCTGQTVTLNASSGTGYTYEWYKNSVLIPGETNRSYAAGQTGSYTVKITSNGCSKLSNPTEVNVNTYLAANITQDTTTCSGDTVTITAKGGGTYLWSTGDTTAKIIVAPNNTRTYSVTVSNGVNCSAVKSSVVTVKQLPNSFILVSGGVTGVCEGHTVMMTASSGTGLSYQWRNNSVDIQGADGYQYIASDAGTYEVLVTLNGCSRLSPSKTLSINPLPVITLSNDTMVCAGAPVTLHASGGVSFEWNTFAHDSIYTVVTTSPKTYTVTVTNSYKCEASASVKVDILPLPTNVSISSSTSLNICEGNSVELRAGNTNGTEFQWMLDSVNISGAVSNTYEASEQGHYTLFVTGSNGCSKVSAPVYLTVKPTPLTPEIIRVGEDSLMSTVEADNYKWFRNGLTFNVGNRTVKAAKTGTYTVVITENNCQSDTSAPYYFQLTGINRNDFTELAIYPNPNSGKFQIELPSSLNDDLGIKVFNTFGQIVWEQNAGITSKHSKQISVDISELLPGIYFLNLESGDKKFMSRVAVSR